jgi:hypothetical protein
MSDVAQKEGNVPTPRGGETKTFSVCVAGSSRLGEGREIRRRSARGGARRVSCGKTCGLARSERKSLRDGESTKSFPPGDACGWVRKASDGNPSKLGDGKDAWKIENLGPAIPSGGPAEERS